MTHDGGHFERRPPLRPEIHHRPVSAIRKDIVAVAVMRRLVSAMRIPDCCPAALRESRDLVAMGLRRARSAPGLVVDGRRRRDADCGGRNSENFVTAPQFLGRFTGWNREIVSPGPRGPPLATAGIPEINLADKLLAESAKRRRRQLLFYGQWRILAGLLVGEPLLP